MIRKAIMNNSELDQLLIYTTVRCVYMHIAEPEDDWSSAPHTHEYCEMCYVAKGSGVYYIDQVEYSMEAGDLFILPKGVIHCEMHCSQERGMNRGSDDKCQSYQLIFIMVDHTGFNAAELAGMLFARPQRVRGLPAMQLRQLFDVLTREVIEHEQGYLSAVECAIKQLYIMLFRDCGLYKFGQAACDIMPECGADAEAVADLKNLKRGHERYDRDILIERLREFISNHIFGDDLSDEIAHEFHYNVRYLSQLVRQATGESLTNYILVIRLENARELLAKTQHSVADVCELCGFKNEAYFFRSFKKESGMTPLQYRIMMKNAPKDDVVKY